MRNKEELPDEAVSLISSVLERHKRKPIEVSGQDLLFVACEQVAAASGIVLQRPLHFPASEGLSGYLEALTRASQCRFRKVTLSGEWWKTDNGPLLAFRKQDHKPCVLIPSRSGNYELIDHAHAQSQLVTKEIAATLSDESYFFYRTFPDKPLNWKNLLHFATSRLMREYRRIFILEIFIGLLGLLVPIFTGIFLDQVVPNADISLLWQLVAGLLASTFAITLFNIALVIGMMRVELKMDFSTQAALWDRLLRLPISIFRKYTAGDLAFRASGIDQIQQTLSSSILMSLISGIFSILLLILLFFYDPLMALGAIGLLVIVIVVELIAVFSQLKYQRRMYHTQGKLSGFVLQLFNNITKLRVAHREPRVFTLWARKFARMSQFFLKSRMIVVRLNVFQSIFSIAALMVLFVMVLSRTHALTFGRFIAFNAAFGQFMAAILAIMSAVSNSLQIIPLYERTRPILKLSPEAEKEKLDPGFLSGAIEINHLFFRYSTEGLPLFKDLSLKIEAKKFVAIVGPSGSGKSTLIRLLLGFEQPESGHIFYDNRDLHTLNIPMLRRQLGVVLQNSTVMPGTILDNITGSTNLPIAHAWKAAEYVAIDHDIRAMPMGMQTIVTESGKTLSMGQRQRIMIARALVRNPKILLLDEATSAIDNATQITIYQHLAKLDITRVVITHRLSTIAHADYIYVLHQGEIVQSGTYDSLLKEKGLFAEMAERQMI